MSERSGGRGSGDEEVEEVPERAEEYTPWRWIQLQRYSLAYDVVDKPGQSRECNLLEIIIPLIILIIIIIIIVTTVVVMKNNNFHQKHQIRGHLIQQPNLRNSHQNNNSSSKNHHLVHVIIKKKKKKKAE